MDIIKENYFNQVKDILNRIIYTHKTHEKMADFYYKKYQIWSIAQVVTDSFTFSGIFLLITQLLPRFQNIIGIFSIILSFAATLISVRNRTFDDKNNYIIHNKTAKNLLELREKYQSFLIDISNDQLTIDEIKTKRKKLQKKLNTVYKYAPKTTKNAYTKACKALDEDEKLKCTKEDEENITQC